MPELVPALNNPTPTADRKIAAYERQLAQRGGMTQLLKDSPESQTVAGVDAAALSRQYGMDNARAPQWKEATFQAPIGATDEQYAKIRFDAIRTFIKTMNSRGFDALTSAAYQPRVSPGVYPAYDLASGFALLDRREMIVGMWFTFRNPKPVRIELPPHLLQPYTVTR